MASFLGGVVCLVILHNWDEHWSDPCTVKRVCKRCGKTQNDTIHQWKIMPSKVTTGKPQLACLRCGQIAKIGSTISDLNVAHRKCPVCGGKGSKSETTYTYTYDPFTEEGWSLKPETKSSTCPNCHGSGYVA